MDPPDADPWGPNTYGTYGSGSATLIEIYACYYILKQADALEMVAEIRAQFQIILEEIGKWTYFKIFYYI